MEDYNFDLQEKINVNGDAVDKYFAKILIY
jgi:hypothetical protein